jgi:SH3-like domain-containing protein
MSLVLVLSACGGRTARRAPSIGEAYVGPAELKLRADIPPEAAAVATVRHGDRLEILQQRRALFLRVRAPNGAEGWVDARQLLGPEDMASLKELAARARDMPSQGIATTYGELRVHTRPARGAPSFLAIKEGDKVDVLASVTAPRAEARRQPLIPPAPKPPKKLAKKSAAAPKYPPPPMPKPPPAPANWLELSKTDLSGEPAPDNTPAPPATPAPTDDWSLIRAANGQAGWALTRALSMAIPDEVAQYAEGHRIVSYFALGETMAGDQKRKQWLWTTIGGGPQPYDFDSFRVFVWSTRRHRYETAHIERNLKGYSPVLVGQVQVAGSKAQAAGAFPGFSICVEKADGQRYRREYAFLSDSVRFAGERPCEAPQPLAIQPAAAPAAPAPAAPAETKSLGRRLREQWGAVKRKLFGK